MDEKIDTLCGSSTSENQKGYETALLSFSLMFSETSFTGLDRHGYIEFVLSVNDKLLLSATIVITTRLSQICVRCHLLGVLPIVIIWQLT